MFHLVFESPWWKGLGAESEEKREPVSDIDTGVVVSLKVLDPDGRLEKRTKEIKGSSRLIATIHPRCFRVTCRDKNGGLFIGFE